MTATVKTECAVCQESLADKPTITHDADGDGRRYCSVRCVQKTHLLSYEQVRILKRNDHTDARHLAQFALEIQTGPVTAQCALCNRRYESQGETEVEKVKPWFRGWCPACTEHVEQVVNGWQEQIVTEGSTTMTGSPINPTGEYTVVPNGVATAIRTVELPPPPLTEPEEKWYPVVYPNVADGYHVSNLGRVLSASGGLLTPVLNGKGLQRVSVQKAGLTRDGRPPQGTTVLVDRLVLSALDPTVGNQPHMVPEHKNGDLSDCRAENLVWRQPTKAEWIGLQSVETRRAREASDTADLWRAVSWPGAIEGYTVSRHGRVRSPEGRDLVATLNGHQWYVSLRKPSGTSSSVRVDRLVLQTFDAEGHRDDLVPGHRNEDPSDNTLTNLFWRQPTPKEAGTLRATKKRQHTKPAASPTPTGGARKAPTEVQLLRVYRLGDIELSVAPDESATLVVDDLELELSPQQLELLGAIMGRVNEMSAIMGRWNR